MARIQLLLLYFGNEILLIPLRTELLYSITENLVESFEMTPMFW